VGVAGAAVTDWRNYDSIYTERFMQTPQNNPEGYARTSCVRAGGDLHGSLLIVHGALDDNVHFQNTLQLISEFQTHRKQFDLMVYPRARHGLGDAWRHWTELWLDYVYEKL
jgi:dipeptidyl aminopeptidase/acylaminoacyl peptidase